MSEINGTCGSNILGLLGVVFVILKLIGVITWSWWWVLCPFWGPLALGIGVFVIISIAAIILTILGG
jgi:hypothetical protein